MPRPPKAKEADNIKTIESWTITCYLISLTGETIVATALAALNGHVANERASREAWQAANAPSIRNYVDVSNTPVAASTSVSNAVADALALAAALNNNSNPLNSAIGQESFLRVQRYSAPQPCGCDTCSCGN